MEWDSQCCWRNFLHWGYVLQNCTQVSPWMETSDSSCQALLRRSVRSSRNRSWKGKSPVSVRGAKWENPNIRFIFIQRQWSCYGFLQYRRINISVRKKLLLIGTKKVSSSVFNNKEHNFEEVRRQVQRYLCRSLQQTIQKVLWVQKDLVRTPANRRYGCLYGEIWRWVYVGLQKLWWIDWELVHCSGSRIHRSFCFGNNF